VEFFKSSAFVVINRAVGALGLIALPFFILHQWLACSWCDKSLFIYKLPLFNTLFDQRILTISDFCLIELACISSFLFRVCYLSAAYDAIIDTHVARMRKMRVKPKKAFIKAVIIGIVLFSAVFMELFLPPAHVNSYGAMKAAAIFIPGVFAFFYAIPEIILYIWLILFGKLDNR
jgi:hypothetical protein